MRTRRFSGATVQEALRAVKAALGADAVILETAEVGGMVTVTAAGPPDESAAVPVAPAPRTARPVAPEGDLAGELRALVGVVRDLVHEHRRQQVPVFAPELQRLHRVLLAQGVDGVIAGALVRETAERLGPGMALDAALAGALAGEPPAAAGQRVRLLIGPPGDGKTMTLAKLAAQARRGGRRVRLITADTYRVGAVAEVETYGRALGARLDVVTGADELVRALADAEDADLVLVDTPGVGPGQTAEMAELGALVDAAGAAASRTLVASAATGSCAAERTCHAFAALRPDACVLTKLDVAPGGAMLAMLWRHGVPVSHVATGRRIPDDLQSATPDRLASCVLAS
jgi:flagellar biosynthesis protein FlhF